MEDSNVCRFRINGTVYVVIEDPDDGYRSCMSELKVLKSSEMGNVFTPIEVVGIYRDKRRYWSCNILELVDINNGKTVLEVGTDNTEDYYPSFVAHFSPENMSTN